MIRRLVEAHFFQNQNAPLLARKKFWLMELRTVELLMQTASANKSLAQRLRSKRPLLAHALAGKAAQLKRALAKEEADERRRDRKYWLPLRRELEKLRHSKVNL